MFFKVQSIILLYAFIDFYINTRYDFIIMQNNEQTAVGSSSPGKDMLEISTEEITTNLKEIIATNVAVWRKNIDGQQVVLPVKKLDEYLKDKDAGNFKFYIDARWKERIKEFESAQKVQKENIPVIDETTLKKETAKFGRVEEQEALFRKMTVVEREEVLDDCITRLHEDGQNMKLDIVLIIKMVNVISNTFYANNADIEANVATESQKESIYGVLVKSDWIVKLLLNHFSRENYPYSDLKIIDKISTGSATIDHINKTFLRFVSFCTFYNEFIDKGLFTKNIRASYKEKYQRYYKKQFPEIEVTIEKIFQDGVRRIEKEKELPAYALGALMFDIGKIRDIKYHDGADPYNEEAVKKHSLNGFNMIVKAKQYSFEVMAMVVFHHEYYNGKGSYKFTKPLLSKFTGKKTAEENIKYFITYDKDEFLNSISLSYFPCKVMEIVDVYTALSGKKNIPPFEALKIMKKEFITKSLKIDPILFKIFMEYNIKCGIITEKEMEGIDAIIF
jgi:HD-GYP domain-containing protein (c-di-GMP phosphodiesterase class II)